MTPSEMAKFSALLTARWPKQPRTADWSKAWLSAFQPFTLDDAVRSLDTLEPQGGAPEGHELVAALRDRGVTADSLVADVLEAIHIRGYTRPPARDEWRSPAIADAVAAWGGWLAVCTEHNLGDAATYAQFRETIRAKITERKARNEPWLTSLTPPLEDQRLLAAAAVAELDDPHQAGDYIPPPPDVLAAIASLDLQMP